MSQATQELKKDIDKTVDDLRKVAREVTETTRVALSKTVKRIVNLSATL